jgi:signal transduction histidine kinase
MEYNSVQKKLFRTLTSYAEQFVPYSMFKKLGFKNISPQSVANFFLVYGFSVIMAGIVFFTSYLFFHYVDHTPFYLFYLISVALCLWVGGIRAAVLNLLLTSLGSFYLFMPYYQNLHRPYLFYMYFSICVAAGLLLGYIFDQVRRSREISRLKKRQELYTQAFIKLHDEYTKALQEIRARDEFLSIASHELKTPLTTMLLKLNNMLNTVKNVAFANFSVPNLMHVLEGAEQQIKWLNTMINDLLNVSLITTGKLNLEPEEVDLGLLAQQIIENFQEIALQEKYSIRFEGSTVKGFWDKARIEQALTNLLSNAIKYGKHKPIDISVANSGRTAKFIIRDHGIGIPPKTQKLLFERFKRAVSPEEHTKGLGVGLYIAKQIINAHGGTIKVANMLSGGTRFTVELPLHKK